MTTQASSSAPPPGAALVFAAARRGLRPDKVRSVSVWAERHRYVPVENSQFPGRWSNATAPYLTEIMDTCGANHPAERVTIKKSAQVGYSEALTNIVGAMIDGAPGPALMVHPTVDAGKNWTAEKLDLSIAATPALRAKVRGVVTRDGTGSVAKRKRYPGGFLIITGANSTRELRQRSVRWLLKDDWSDWPADVDGQGDPDKMAEARTLGFQSSGQTKIVQGSTPTLAGRCRVSDAYERSDKRVYEVPCPNCEWFQALRFFPDDQGRGGLRYNRQAPHNARYECEACGELIDHARKRELVARGRWRATNPAGTHPGFHINALVSPFTTWDRIVSRYVEAEGKPAELKTFWNLDLGEAYTERGEAPPWEELKKRAEDYPLGRVPARAHFVTVGCDVQKAGIFFEVVAWGRGRESWSIGAGFLAGDTADRASAAWQGMDALYAARYPLEGGDAIAADVLAIDANYNTDQVCDWVRGKPYAIAVRGVDGWDRAVFGMPTKTDVSWNGQKRRRSARIWPVSVWSLKGELYAHLRKAPKDGDELPPEGMCHFPTAHPSEWYQQLTADHLKEVERRGRRVLKWTTSGANHFHDCRIYAMAAHVRAAQLHGVLHDDEAAWSRLIARRRPGAPQGELALDSSSAPVPALQASPAPPPPASSSPSALPPPRMRAPRPRSPWRIGSGFKPWRH